MKILFKEKNIINQIYPITLFAGIVNLSLNYSNYVSSYIDKKPNIIFILVDDLGYSELGCYGNQFNETPNLDRLASQGVRFTQAYSAAPVSSPSRTAIMTGQHPARTGITDYLRPDSRKFLDTSYITLPEILKSNGYHTGIIGKWHLTGYISNNAPWEILPDKHGFDEIFTSETSGIGDGTYFYPYHFNPGLEKKLPEEKEFLVDRMNFEALQFIEKNCKKPFFLYLSHYAVHTMLHGKPETVDYFRGKANCGSSSPSKNNPRNDPYTKWPSDYFAPKNNPHLAAQLKDIDTGVGMICRKLKELGIENNTIIIFTSDNGGESRVTDNSPLRAGKSTLYEGGIRVPLIIYQPERITGGRVINEITVNYDFYPTICELSGTELPKSQIIDGTSLVQILYGKKDKSKSPRVFYWHYPLEKKHFLGGRSSGAIRDVDWKLIEFYDTGEIELYNIKEDIDESENLLYKYPDKVKELHKKLIDWRKNILKTNISESLLKYLLTKY